MKYLLVNFQGKKKIIRVSDDRYNEAARHLYLQGYSPMLVGKPPSPRTIGRWKKTGKCRALCNCYISCLSGQRCEVHNMMSWLTVLR